MGISTIRSPPLSLRRRDAEVIAMTIHMAPRMGTRTHILLRKRVINIGRSIVIRMMEQTA